MKRVALPWVTSGLSAWLVLGASVFGQPSQTVVPARISLAAPAGGNASTTITVSPPAGRQASFTASARYFGAGWGWLTVSPQTGVTPATVTLYANASTLSDGVYGAQVVIAGDAGDSVVDVLFSVGSGDANSPVTVDQASLTFIDFGDGQPTAQDISVNVRDSNSGAMTFTAYTTSSDNWLTVSPFPMTAPGTLTVSALTSGLAPGVYNGTVTIVPSGRVNPLIVPVTALVSGDGREIPTLTLSQTALKFNYQIESPARPVPAQTVTLSVSSGVQSYTATTSAGWVLLTSSTTGATGASATGVIPDDLQVQINPTGLVTGTYNAAVTITTAGISPVVLPVTLTVTNTQVLNAFPSSIVFDDVNGMGTSVTVTASGSTPIFFNARVGSGASWLHADPGPASTGGEDQLFVSADTTNLVAGVYTGTVKLTAQSGTASFDIPVTLTVPGTPDTGTLAVSSQTLELSNVVGSNNPSATLSVTTSVPEGTQDFTADASSTGGWLRVQPFRASAPAVLKITAGGASVPGPGSYSGSVAVTSLVSGQQFAIPVTFTLSAPNLQASPASLTFSEDGIGASLPVQQIRITSNLPGQFSVTNRSNWISVSPARGATPADLTVSVNPAGLAPGVTNGSIVISGASELTVPVSVTIPEPPHATATPGDITLDYELGSAAPAPISVLIGTTGTDPLNFTAIATTDSGVPWLKIYPTSGLTPTSMDVSIDTSLLVPGETTGTITLMTANGSGTPLAIPVILKVTPSGVTVLKFVNGATFLPTAVAPGQIITIMGSALGPATGVSAVPSAAGAFDTQLAGTRVFFDDVPAPMLFVRSDQINAVAPYELQGRATTRVHVETADHYSVPAELKVVDAAPGIFTSSGTGTGLAAAINEDGTINSQANPAPRGSIVSIYGTGEGQTNPGGQDGRIILTDLRRPLLPVTAKVGGHVADIVYVGSAPTLVSGALQVNVRIPQDIDPGAVPVEIVVNGTGSQPGVTIAVR